MASDNGHANETWHEASSWSQTFLQLATPSRGHKISSLSRHFLRSTSSDGNEKVRQAQSQLISPLNMAKSLSSSQTSPVLQGGSPDMLQVNESLGRMSLHLKIQQLEKQIEDLRSHCMSLNKQHLKHVQSFEMIEREVAGLGQSCRIQSKELQALQKENQCRHKQLMHTLKEVYRTLESHTKIMQAHQNLIQLQKRRTSSCVQELCCVWVSLQLLQLPVSQLAVSSISSLFCKLVSQWSRAPTSSFRNRLRRLVRLMLFLQVFLVLRYSVRNYSYFLRFLGSSASAVCKWFHWFGFCPDIGTSSLPQLKQLNCGVPKVLSLDSTQSSHTVTPYKANAIGLHSPGNTVTELHSTADTGTDLHRAGENGKHLHRAEHTVTDLHRTGGTVTDVPSAIDTVTDLHWAMETVTDIHRAEPNATGPDHL